MDGVIVDFTAGWVSRYNRDFGADIQVEDVVTWGAPRQMTHFTTMSEFWNWVKSCGEGASLFRRLDPYPGAIDSLHELRLLGHEIVIVTTKPHFAISDTHEWLAEHQIPTTEVHIVSDKSEVDCDVYIDDGPHNLERLIDQRPDRCIIRYIRPWNRPIEGVKDAESWPDIHRVIEGCATTLSS